jgi:UDP-2,3-diacylglucosamine pyrophosphatase LpxH
VHGDRFDETMICAPWLTRLGDALYYVVVALNDAVNNTRRWLGKPYWPFVEQIKLGIGPSLRYIERFEQVATNHARAEGYDGIVCGHIHRANLRHIDGTVYCNTGDWVESCSALIETLDGELQLLRWPNGLSPARRTTTQLVADAA